MGFPHWLDGDLARQALHRPCNLFFAAVSTERRIPVLTFRKSAREHDISQDVFVLEKFYLRIHFLFADILALQR